MCSRVACSSSRSDHQKHCRWRAAQPGVANQSHRRQSPALPYPVHATVSLDRVRCNVVREYYPSRVLALAASTTVSAVILTMRRTVAAGVRMCTGAAHPKRMGPMATF
jgi:hypothetical protein